MSEFSIYRFDCGQLKIFGRSSTRAKYPTISEAIYGANKYLNQLMKINPRRDFSSLQIVVVEYTSAYQSKIVAILSSEEVQSIALNA